MNSEQKSVVAWIEAALAYGVENGVSRATVGKSVWPDDRSKLGKTLKGRKAQTGELAKIAKATGYPPYIAGDAPADAPERIRTAPEPKIEGPKRTPVTFYVKEWRKFCEVSPSAVAKALGIDGDDYGLLENKPYRFSVEQLVAVADTLKIRFDSMRWNPLNLPAPQPAKSDIARINKARGRK